MEKTLAIVKPDAFEHSVEIMDLIMDKTDLFVFAWRTTTIKVEDAVRFYEEHAKQPFFEGLVEHMTSGPCLLMVLEGDDAVNKWQTLLGQTDPQGAEMGTVRARYGTELPKNAAHGSNSVESAEREIGFFFPDVN